MLLGLLIFVLFGALYFTWDDMRFKNRTAIPREPETSFFGVVVNNPRIRGGAQEFKLQLKEPFRGNVLVKSDWYPTVLYGDVLRIEGTIEHPFSESYAKYLEKERISGVVSFARVFGTSEKQGNALKSFLFGIRNGVL